MALTLPYTIGPLVLSAPLNVNFQSIADKFSGGIVDADISTLAGISGAKVAQNTMPGDRIASGTVANLQMGANSINTTQLFDLAVTKAKLSVTAGNRVTKSQVEITPVTIACALSTGGGNSALLLSAILTTGVVSSVSSWGVYLMEIHTNGGTNAATFLPTTAIPSATTSVIGYTIRDLSITNGGVTCNVVLWCLANS